MLATEVHRWFLSGCNGAWRRPCGHGQGAVWAKVVDGSAEIQIQGDSFKYYSREIVDGATPLGVVKQVVFSRVFKMVCGKCGLR